jgi:hypothetical protein
VGEGFVDGLEGIGQGVGVGVSEDRGVEADGVEEELTFDPETIGGECGEVVDGVLQEARPLLAGLGAFLAFEAGDPGSVLFEADAKFLGDYADEG